MHENTSDIEKQKKQKKRQKTNNINNNIKYEWIL